MRLMMLISFLPAAMAAFDKCARPNGEWAGFDQAYGESYAYTAAHHGTHIYVGGRAAGSLSYATSHNNGDYHDHIGTHAAHKSHTDVAADAAHHETASFAAPDAGYADAATSTYGMDNFIYKISETGQPISVYGWDLTTSDGKTDGTSENDNPYGYPAGIDGFEGAPDMIAVTGHFMGKIKFPKADGTTFDLVNRKASYWDSYVAKIDMATGSAVWVTGEGLEGRGYARSVVTTDAGHVIAATERRLPTGSYDSANLTKFNGDTGALVWQKSFGAHFRYYYTKMSSSGEKVYLPVQFKGKDSTAFAPAQALTTSCGDGEDKSSVVAEFDVSSLTSDGPSATWVTPLGCGNGATATFLEGNNLYVYGYNGEALILPHDSTSTEAKCTLSGDLGGFLVKLNKADGKCLWAVDTGSPSRYPKMVANADAVWIATATSGSVKLDADQTVSAAGGYDLVMAKFQASDGVGLWGSAMGGTDTEYMYDMTMTQTGPVSVGYSRSPSVSLGAVTTTNLQRQAANAEEPGTPGPSAMFVMQISTTDVVPSCLTCPSGGDRADATISAGKCYADEQCIDGGSFSTVNVCFRCDPSTPRVLTPTTDNHCYIDSVCYVPGFDRPAFRSYNSNSVCESCQPAVDGNNWSPNAGFWQDQKFAGETGASHDCGWTTSSRGGYGGKPGPCAPNNYGILFTRNSNGCQVLPEITMPTTAQSDALKGALATPSAGTELARITSAIAAAQSVTSNAQTALMAAWYSGDTASCTKVTITGVGTTTHGPCQNTPAAHADAMAAAFDTNMHYGHSVARIKVQQALAILNDDLSPPKTTTAPQDQIEMDILAHMLIPLYQGAIKAAYDMDTKTTDADKAAALAEGLAYWNLIHPNVPGFNAADKARLVALFGSEAASGTHNYCEVKAILHRNLPGSSMLQYGQKPHDKLGSRSTGAPTLHSSGLPTASAMHLPHKYATDDPKNHHVIPGSTHGLVTPVGGNGKEWSGDYNPVAEPMEAVEIVHLQERDIGVLKAAADLPACVFPPPAPPPPAPSSPPVESSDSGLTDGEIAGVAIGAAVGGIVLLGLVALILRSLLVKDAKPVFTCLEKGDVKPSA